MGELGLTRNQWDNFQKLRYWNLVSQTYADGKRKRGVWEVTDLGRKFLAGEHKIHVNVVTYRGTTVRYVGDLVSANGELETHYKQLEDYIS